LRGSGYSVCRNDTGDFTVSFNEPFDSPVVVVAQGTSTFGSVPVSLGSSNSCADFNQTSNIDGFRVRLVDFNGTTRNGGFSFIATGT
jgi:hypothetical protein